MRRLTRGFRKGEKGFTLIELLVVIAILGIIAAIVVPNFGTFFGRGQDEACNIELRMVQTATFAYVADTGNCPASITVLENANYFQPGSTFIGTYVIAGTSPACTVTQTCPSS